MEARDFRDIFLLAPLLASTLEPQHWRAMCLTCRDWQRSITEADFAIDWGYDNDRALRWAAREGYADQVRFLLSKQLVNPAALDNAPLTLASLGGHVDVVEQLLACPYTLPRPEALAGAMIKRHEAVVQRLIASGRLDFSVEPAIQGAERLTRAAAEYGLPVLLVLSIEAGNFPTVFQHVYDIKATDDKWFPTLFRLAAEKGRHEIVLYLLHRHLPVKPTEQVALDVANLERWCRRWLKSDRLSIENCQRHLSVVAAHLSVERLAHQCIRRDRSDFLKHLADRAGLELSAKHLFESSRYGALSCLQFLVLERDMDPLTRGQKVFRTAIEHAKERIVDWLLSSVAGIDPSLNDNIPIRLACQSGSVGIVERLLAEPGVSAYACGNLPLRHAAEHGYTEIVRSLLERGGPRVDPACDGGTPLVNACAGGHSECVGVLLADSRVSVTPEAVMAAVSHATVLAQLINADATALDAVHDKETFARGLIAAGQLEHLGAVSAHIDLRRLIWNFFERIPKVKSKQQIAELLTALEHIIASAECRDLVPTNELLRLINFYAKHSRWEAICLLCAQMDSFPHRSGQVHKPADLLMAACRKLMRADDAPEEMAAPTIEAVLSGSAADELTAGFKKEVAAWRATE